MSPPVVSFVGLSDAGKTTFLEKLVREFGRRGYRVAVAKHTHHAGFQLDRPGKDSWRFSQAGACAVLLSADNRIALLEETDQAWQLQRLASLLGDRADLVLAEGFKGAKALKVEVRRSGVSDGLITPVEWLLAVVTDVPLATGVPQFGHDQVGALADYLAARLPLSPARQADIVQPSGAMGRSEGLRERPGPSIVRLEMFLREASAYHGHLCPGQVLGVRMALRGCEELGIALPDEEKRLLAFVEIDRCGSDAVYTVTGCRLGTRSLKYLDYGKLAASFLDMRTGRAVRIAAREDSRERARLYAPHETDRHLQQIQAYQAMPDDELFTVQQVRIQLPEEDLPGAPRRRVACEACAEGISDGREVRRDGRILCRPCASGTPYYTPVHLAF